MLRLAVVGVALAVLVPSTASAYRTLTDEPALAGAQGQPIGWTRWPLRFEVFEQEGDLIGGAATYAAVVGGIAVWSGSTCVASALEAGGMASMPAQLDDGRNTVQWIHSGWEAYGGPNAVAITQTRYLAEAGNYFLADADIYLNGTKAWSASMLDQLDGVMAHELGHALGLVHPCEANGEHGAPRCGTEPVTLMHPSYNPQAFSLTADDDEGACFIYPEAQPRKAVVIEKACSVSAVGEASRVPVLTLLLMMASTLALLRRGRVR